MVCGVEPASASLVCHMRGVRAMARFSAVCWSGIPPSSCSLPFGNLRHLPIRVVWCARLWLALPVSVDRKSVVTNSIWFAGIAGAIGMGLGLTMLPDAGSHGRFCADMSVGAVSAGPEAEEAGSGARVSGLHLHAKPKNRFLS
eukprot:scaffold2020_cov107-Isochrysis_galbana.AAC.8